MATSVVVQQPQNWQPYVQESVHLAMPADQQQTPSGYQAQVMMPADKDWEKNQAPVLMSVKEQKKADEEPTAEGLPLTDPSMQAD